MTSGLSKTDACVSNPQASRTEVASFLMIAQPSASSGRTTFQWNTMCPKTFTANSYTAPSKGRHPAIAISSFVYDYSWSGELAVKILAPRRSLPRYLQRDCKETAKGSSGNAAGRGETHWPPG